MKSYIIRLSDFTNSVEWSNKAYKSAKKYNWDVEFFEGINGQKETLADYKIKINKKHKKSISAFERPGTVGCFLSHYKLWKKCLAMHTAICVLEHDVIINKSLSVLPFKNVLKLFKGPNTKPMYLGKWWASGAAYCITPCGASKLIRFVELEGAMPADVMLNTGIVDIEFNNNNLVEIDQQDFSFTWNL